LSEPNKPANYFILLDICPSMTWRQSFGWMLSRIILLLQKMSIFSEKIFGPDVATLKGKTTHRAPIPVIEDHIEIPREWITAQYSVTLCLDGMKVNDISFLTTISKNLMYRTARYVQRPLTSVYCKCLQQVLRIYTLGGLRVTTIHCDNEFHPLWTL
jgi:hypothetical protein